MNEYYFLLGLAFVWIIFATVQDVRKREVSNWLNFSLIAFALGYRLCYAYYYSEWSFFVLGVAGFAVFVAVGNGLYYSKSFGGGDAKLLMGIGAVLPYELLGDLWDVGGAYLAILFSVGAVYSLVYTIFLAYRGGKTYSDRLSENMRKNGAVFIAAAIAMLFLVLLLGADWITLMICGAMFLLPFIYSHLRAVEAGMIKLVEPKKLTEGDWLEKDVHIGRKWIRKSVHGLSMEEIILLRKANRKVWIKEGVPFGPAFSFSWIITVFFWTYGLLRLSSLASVFV